MEEKIYIVVEECMETDGTFHSQPFPCKKALEAYDMMCHLIDEMAQKMNLTNVDVEKDTHLEGDGWYYDVRVEIFDF